MKNLKKFNFIFFSKCSKFNQNKIHRKAPAKTTCFNGNRTTTNWCVPGAETPSWPTSPTRAPYSSVFRLRPLEHHNIKLTQQKFTCKMWKMFTCIQLKCLFAFCHIFWLFPSRFFFVFLNKRKFYSRIQKQSPHQFLAFLHSLKPTHEHDLIF